MARRKKIASRYAPYNGNILISEPELAEIEEQIARHEAEILKLLRFAPNDPNTKETPHRRARYLVREALQGRFNAMPDLKAFPNGGYDGPVYEDIFMQCWSFDSTCAHHELPFSGVVIVGVKWRKNTPSHLLGLSKYIHLMRHYERRFQLQERLGEQVADALLRETQAEGVGVLLQAKHSCVSCRGVLEPLSRTRTISMRGTFKTKHKAEFVAHANNMLPPAIPAF